MSRLVVTGYQGEEMARVARQLRAEVFLSAAAQNPQMVSEGEFTGAAACLVNEPMRLPALADTMTCRGFFEQIKNCLSCFPISSFLKYCFHPAGSCKKRLRMCF